MTNPTLRRLRLAAVGLATSLLLLGGTLAGSAPASADTLPFTTSPVPTLAPAPVVDGVTRVSVGTWTPTPSSFSYQWFKDGAPVAGVTGTAIRLTDADQGVAVTVAVTASLAGYSTTTETSAPVTVLGRITATNVAVTGLPKPGDTVTAAGSFVPSDADLAYQWSDGSTPIDGATSQTYVPTEDQAGDSLSVEITATKDGYAESQFSGATTVTGDTMKTAVPFISGFQRVGATLTAQLAYGWYPTPTTVRDQWRRDGVDIDGATSSTYVPTSDDVGHILTFRQTGSHAEFPDASVISSSSQPILQAFDAVTAPVISSTPVVGVPLTVTIPTWTPAATSYSYQWFVNGRQDTSTYAATYTPNPYEVGDTITVQVYGSSATRGLTLSPMSDPSQPVLANPFQLGPVTIGSVHLARAVTVKFAAPPASVSVAYQWLLDGSPIVGATDATYTPQGHDWGKHLSVRLSVSGTGYAPSTVTSNSERVNDGTIEQGGVQIAADEEARVGVTLHAVPLGWQPGVTVHYIWEDFSKLHDLSHSSSYKVPASEKGHKIYLWSWGSAPHMGNTKKEGYIGEDYRVGAGLFFTTPVPTISGTAKVGSQLTVHRGTWAPATSVSYSYQWYAQSSPTATPVAISHATHSTYTPTASRVGQTITVRVTAHKHEYTSVTETSLATETVVD